jgi:hypothetical protein
VTAVAFRRRRRQSAAAFVFDTTCATFRGRSHLAQAIEPYKIDAEKPNAVGFDATEIEIRERL